MFSKILVALDDSDHAEKALGIASDLAAKYSADLIALHVISDHALSEAERHMAEIEYGNDVVNRLDAGILMQVRGEPRVVAKQLIDQYAATGRVIRRVIAEKLMDTAQTRARAHGVAAVETVIEEGDPAKAILGLAKDRGVDLIVMGSRGRSAATDLLMGSVSHKVGHLAACSCIMVK